MSIPCHDPAATSPKRLEIAILSPLWPEAIARLQQSHRCRVAENPPPELKRRVLAAAEVVILRSPVVLDRATLEAAPRLRLVIRAGMGLDSIDLAFARERGLRVVTVPLSADAVAEHALGLLLAVARGIPRLDRSLREGRWEKHAGYGTQLSGQTLGLLGFGRIGRRLAEIARVLRMTLAAHDRSPQKPQKQEAASRFDVRFVAAEELFATTDAVSIQLPLNEDTRGLVDARLLARMKPEAVLVNVGRGGVVDEEALFAALDERRIAGAALDVFAREPPGDHPLLTLDNFIATPHVGAQTAEAQRRVGRDVVRIVEALAAGKELPEPAGQ